MCLSCYNGSCGRHTPDHFRVGGSSHAIILNIKRTLIESKQPEEPVEKISCVGIGVPGGISLEEPLYLTETRVSCLACQKEIDLTQNEPLSLVVSSCLEADSASKKQQEVPWELRREPCTHTKNLKQLDGAPQLAVKSLAHCQSCEVNENLWLCLTCGALGCARKNFDGTGGNAHAVQHNQATGFVFF